PSSLTRRITSACGSSGQVKSAQASRPKRDGPDVISIVPRRHYTWLCRRPKPEGAPAACVHLHGPAATSWCVACVQYCAIPLLLAPGAPGGPPAGHRRAGSPPSEGRRYDHQAHSRSRHVCMSTGHKRRPVMEAAAAFHKGDDTKAYEVVREIVFARCATHS